ncbi:hypothetical protein HJC23_012210 [Cyclotella cryptica]|uniref:Uncharacterized protein n=1 Tax=Cyclotella cryptica TaxID=29204 RepID=A0ABD3PTZ4_9STRA
MGVDVGSSLLFVSVVELRVASEDVESVCTATAVLAVTMVSFCSVPPPPHAGTQRLDSLQ